MVTASLMRGQNSLTSLTRDLLPLAPVTLQLEVPGRLQGEYRLEVRGIDLTSMEGDLFQHSVPLTVVKPSQLVGLRLDQRSSFLVRMWSSLSGLPRLTSTPTPGRSTLSCWDRAGR